MSATITTVSPILQQYAKKTPGSAERYERAKQLFPSGITHDSRYLTPYPLYVTHATGSRKWDVDGNEYLDFFGGHGSLILGHSHPAIVEAVARQIARGTHLGACHDLEIEWGSLVCEMIPCAERVRFTSTGTEATLLGLRVARAFTGKPKFVRFAGHFHGWHDHVAFGGAPGPVEYPRGIVPAIVDNVIVCPPNDAAALQSILENNNDIAAVIVEPTGASFSHVPQSKEYLAEVRRLTAQHQVVLIFDEVITGFRCSPGGAQQAYGITPDLTTLAKILAGGYPGGALAGKAEIMNMIQYSGMKAPAVPHQGTFNATPVSAAAGITALKLIQSGEATDTANRICADLRSGMNAVAERYGWSVYGDFSGFHVFTNPGKENITAADIQAGKVDWRKLKASMNPEVAHRARIAFLNAGVDVCSWPGGWTSAVNTPADVDFMVSAFEQVMQALAAEGFAG